MDYRYCFDRYAGPDKVWNVDALSLSAQQGDLIEDAGTYFCVLGSNVAFPVLYTYVYRPNAHVHVYEKQFLSDFQCSLLHHIVYTYYTSYSAAMRLLLPHENIVGLLATKKKSVKPYYNPVLFDSERRLFVFADFTSTCEGQQLIVVPDLWTAYNLFDDTILDVCTIWHSGLTQLQMTKIFWGCKQGQIGTLITTLGGIFHDWKHLQRILFVQPEKRYYQHQQDPRYKVGEVLQFIADFWKIDVQRWG